MRRIATRFLIRHFFGVCLSVVVFIVAIIIICIRNDRLCFENDIKLAEIATLLIFLLGLLQLMYNGRLQRTGFVRDYAEEFFTNKELYCTFHELVYQYSDEIFDQVAVAVQKMERENLLTEKTPKPFANFGEIVRDKSNMKWPPYHPKYFQGSREERRLDMLFGYFDLLGYHHSRGFLSVEDIAGSLGYYLNILSKRKVIRETRNVYREAVHARDYAAKNGRIPPFRYFDNLMRAIEKLNGQIEERSLPSNEF